MAQIGTGMIVSLIITLVHIFVSMALFAHRRDKFPMSGHSLPLVLVASIGNAAIILTAIDEMVGYDACFTVWFINVGVSISTPTLIARCWRIWFFYTFAGEQLRSAATDQQMWLAKYRQHFTTKRLVIYVAVTAALWSFMGLVPFLLNTSAAFSGYLNGATWCDEFISARVILQVGVAIAILALFFTAYKLRRVNDGYYLRRDCFVNGVLLMGKVIAGGIATASSIHYILAVLLNIQVFAMTTSKVLISYRSDSTRFDNLRKRQKAKKYAERRSSSVSTSSSASSLKQVLDEPALRKLFGKHLTSEFSAENLVFYEKVLDFQEKCGDEAWSLNNRNHYAMGIYMDFIKSGGKLQVNLPSNILVDLEHKMKLCIVNFSDSMESFRVSHEVKSFKPVPDDVFDVASKCIFDLMASDSFVRFKIKMIEAGQDLKCSREKPDVAAKKGEDIDAREVSEDCADASTRNLAVDV